MTDQLSLLHLATRSNTWAHRTVINSNGRFDHHEDQIVIVCPQYGTPAPGVPFAPRVWIGNVAAQFVTALQRWTIVSLGANPIPIGSVFAVIIMEPNGPSGWVHRVNRTNSVGNVSYIEYPASVMIRDIEARHPGTIPRDQVYVTPRLPAVFGSGEVRGWAIPPVLDLVPGGWGFASATRELRNHLATVDHSLGVWYDERIGKWGVFNTDFEMMSTSAEFSVHLSGVRFHPSIAEHYRAVVTTGREGSSRQFCLDPCDWGYAFFAIQNASFAYAPDIDPLGAPGGTSVSFCTDPVAVSVTRSSPRAAESILAVVTQSGAPFGRGVGFNVLHLTAGLV